MNLCIAYNPVMAVTMQIDHTEYPKKLQSMPEYTLRYIIKDAQEAIRALPTSDKVGYWQDEINYCVNELYRRKRKPK